MRGHVFGCAVIPVVSRPPKSNHPTVSSSPVTSVGNEDSTRARTRPPCATTCVLASPAVRSRWPVSLTARASSRNVRVRTHRLRYQAALPSTSRTPWSMPSPRNQCGETPVFGLGPFRR